ncbi:MAG: GMC family oxidoreductase N-terminal domain-containing protein [Pseudomonadota bacterium]
MNNDDLQHYDYLIVGAGTAGCLLANRLSANPANKVLLIEAGGNDSYPWVHIPVGYLYCIGNPRTDWMYQTATEAGLNGRQLLYPRGKLLGGCSSINGMIYMRGQSRDYDNWAKACGDSDWCWQNALPDFLAHEDHYHLDHAESLDESLRDKLLRSHASGGEWRVEKQRLSWDILDAFEEAAVEAGLERTEDFNSGNNAGVGYFEVNQMRGRRLNTAQAFLHPIRHRKNLQVWTHTVVEKLAVQPASNGRNCCVGARLLRGGERVSVQATKEVVLAAGAIGTPQVLQLSGIGPGPLLQNLQIDVRHELPGVGQNLQDHLQIRSVFKVQNVTTLNTLSATLWGKARIALEYAFKRSGPMSMAPSQLGAFMKSSEDKRFPDLEFHVQPLSLEAFGQPLHKFPALTVSVCNLNPESRGEVSIQSNSINKPPRIAPNYLSTDADKLIAAQSLRKARDIAAQPALSRFKPTEWKPGAQYQSDEELSRLAGDIASTIFHPVGTAKMGKADDPGAVVDSRLRVLGVDGLRIADASVMPTITSGNTNSPTLMIAEKAARYMLQEAS